MKKFPVTSSLGLIGVLYCPPRQYLMWIGSSRWQRRSDEFVDNDYECEDCEEDCSNCSSSSSSSIIASTIHHLEE